MSTRGKGKKRMKFRLLRQCDFLFVVSNVNNDCFLYDVGVHKM